MTAAASTYVLLSGHLLITSTIDLLVWVLVMWLTVRMLRSGETKLWVAIGVVTGLGLLNKQLPIVLAGGVLVGMALTPSARRMLRSRWLVIGAVIAAAAWAPVLVWQAQHGWPQLTFASQIRAEYGTASQRVTFFARQLLLFGLGATLLWITALLKPWRDPAWQRYKVLAWPWLVVFAFFVVTAGQGYYPAGTYPALIAVGAVVVERWRRRWAVVAVVLVTSALTLPAALPILSPAALAGSPWNGMAEPQRETIGWPQLVNLVAAAYRSIPADRRAHAGIYTTNFGEAGAVDRFGPALGPPQVWSGQNGYGLCGPPPQTVGPVVVVWEDDAPTTFFTGCRKFADVTAPVTSEESNRAAVYVCVTPVHGWQHTWTLLKRLSS